MIDIKKLEQEIDLLLQPDDPRVKYQSTRDFPKATNMPHWGQRKLLLSEIWFLTKYGNLSQNVIYAGSAPGTHIPYLSQMFPTHIFHLVDPSQFRMKGDTKNIKTYKEYFTNALAEMFKQELNQDYLFISDIRTANIIIPGIDNYDIETQNKMRIEKNNEVEVMVARDHQWQQQWCQIMNPKKALLKFRCPYSNRDNIDSTFEYMDGLIFKQQWVGATSSESRLVPHDYFQTISYDIQKYEDQFFYHNQYIRKNNIINSQKAIGNGLTKNWDSAAEVLILGKYIQQYSSNGNPSISKVLHLSNEITKNISLSGRTLKTVIVKKKYKQVDHVGKVGVNQIL